MDDVTDATIAASEARLRGESNEKLAELRGEMKLVSNKLDTLIMKVDGFDTRLFEQRADLDKRLAEQSIDFKADFRSNRTLMIGLAVSVPGLILAMVLAVFTVGGTMFSRGMSVRDVVREVIAEQQQSAPQKP